MREGRPPEEGPGKTRSERLTTRFTGEDITGMDETRGTEPRSDFVRTATRERIARMRQK